MIKKKLFFLNIPVYDRELCIIVGMTHGEAVAAAKKQRCTKDFLACLNSPIVKEQEFWIEKLVNGTAIKAEPENYFLLLRPYQNKWEYFDTLNHEVFHLVQFIGKHLGFWDDIEPTAYLHTWLSKKLRRILRGNELHKK